jgi:hypothetical protein
MITAFKYQNYINSIFLVLFIAGFSFFNNSFISFKLIYVLQILIVFFFYFQYKKIKIEKNILLLNLIILICLFYKFDKSYIYLFLICILNVFFNLRGIDKIIIKKNLICCIIFTFLVFFTFRSNFFLFDGNSKEIFLYDQIILNLVNYKNCTISMMNLKDIRFISGLGGECNSNIVTFRYGIMGLQANLSAILCLLVSYIFLKGLKKKLFIMYFSLFGAIFLYITLSKSGLIFFVLIIFLSLFEINKKMIFLSFFLLHLLIGVTSFNLIQNIPNVWNYGDGVSQVKSDIYYVDFCNKIKDVPILNVMSECKYENKITLGNKLEDSPALLLVNIFGISSFYKFYSYGMIIEHISTNFKDYLMPNPVNRMLDEKKLTISQVTGELSAHSLFFLTLIKYGVLLSIIFFINLYIFFTKHDDNKLFIAFIFSSMFLSLDIFLLFPLYLLSIFVYSGYKST